jgi:hypothetical protein
VAAAQQAAAQQAEADKDQALEECAVLRKAAVKAFRGAEGSYRKGLLDTGRLCHEYVVKWMAPPVNGSRDAAVQTLEGQLGPFSSRKIDVSRMVRCWAAHSLLCEAGGFKSDVPYGHYEHAWSQLCERLDKDTKDEHWALLPGMEQECKDVFRECVEHSTDRDGVKKRVDVLVADYAKRVDAAKKAKHKEVQEHAESLNRQADAALATVEEKAEEVAELVQGVTKATTEEEKKAAAELLEQGKQELRDAQKQQQAAEHKRQEAQKDVQKSTREVKQAALAKDRAERKVENLPAPARTRPEGCRADNLLQGDTCGTVKDTVEMVVNWITKHDKPTDVLEGVLRALAKHASMSRRDKRACDQAVAILEGKSADVSLKTA